MLARILLEEQGQRNGQIGSNVRTINQTSSLNYMIGGHSCGHDCLVRGLKLLLDLDNTPRRNPVGPSFVASLYRGTARTLYTHP